MSDAVFHRADDNSIILTIEDARYSQVIETGRSLEDDGVEFWVEQVDE